MIIDTKAENISIVIESFISNGGGHLAGDVHRVGSDKRYRFVTQDGKVTWLSPYRKIRGSTEERLCLSGRGCAATCKALVQEIEKQAPKLLPTAVEAHRVRKEVEEEKRKTDNEIFRKARALQEAAPELLTAAEAMEAAMRCYIQGGSSPDEAKDHWNGLKVARGALAAAVKKARGEQ